MKIAHILHPTDFSECSKAAMDYVKTLAREHDAKITLLFAVDDMHKSHGWYVPHISIDELYKDMEESAKKQLERCCYEELRDFKQVDRVVLRGMPDDVIAKYADENNVDMIIMGAYSKSGLDSWFGSTTRNVLKRSKCPVLCVKAPVCQTA